jgi:hypothetical protein
MPGVPERPRSAILVTGNLIHGAVYHTRQHRVNRWPAGQAGGGSMTALGENEDLWRTC